MRFKKPGGQIARLYTKSEIVVERIVPPVPLYRSTSK
jgi:hypothetical protein